MSLGIGAIIGLLWIWPVGPVAKKRMEAKRASKEADQAAAAAKAMSSLHSIGSNKKLQGEQLAEYDPEVGTINIALDESVASVKLKIDKEVPKEETAMQRMIDTINISEKKTKKKNLLVKFEEATYKQNLQDQCFQENKKTQECWENATIYDTEVEQLFTYVQAFTAALNSFAHGANDIANAIAPVAAVIDIYQNGKLDTEAPVQKWILAYGGVALVLGLLLYGYNVMKTIGYKLTAVSPTRGSSAGLASSLVVATASYMGIPVSTTQSIVGAVAGIGLVEGYKNVQWMQLAKVGLFRPSKTCICCIVL